jgi:hypothetical protein
MTVERDPRGCFTAGRLARVAPGAAVVLVWDVRSRSGRTTSLCRAWPRPRSKLSPRRRGTDWTAGQGSLRPYSSCMRWLLADRRGCRALIRRARSRQPSRRRRADAARRPAAQHRGLFVRGHDERRTTPVAGLSPAQIAVQRGEAADVRAGRGDGREIRDQRRVQWSVFLALRAARWNTHSGRPANRVVVRTAPWIRLALVFLAVGLPGPPERNSAPLALAPLCC